MFASKTLALINIPRDAESIYKTAIEHYGGIVERDVRFCTHIITASSALLRLPPSCKNKLSSIKVVSLNWLDECLRSKTLVSTEGHCVSCELESEDDEEDKDVMCVPSSYDSMAAASDHTALLAKVCYTRAEELSWTKSGSCRSSPLCGIFVHLSSQCFGAMRETLENYVTILGGKVVDASYAGTSCTVIANDSSIESLLEMRCEEVLFATPFYLQQCYKAGRKLQLRLIPQDKAVVALRNFLFIPPPCSTRIEHFEHFFISITGFVDAKDDGDDIHQEPLSSRNTVKEAIKASGACFLRDMAMGITTHLVCADTKSRGAKYISASRWGNVQIVSLDWLLACLEQRRCVPTDAYIINDSVTRVTAVQHTFAVPELPSPMIREVQHHQLQHQAAAVHSSSSIFEVDFYGTASQFSYSQMPQSQKKTQKALACEEDYTETRRSEQELFVAMEMDPVDPRQHELASSSSSSSSSPSSSSSSSSASPSTSQKQSTTCANDEEVEVKAVDAETIAAQEEDKAVAMEEAEVEEVGEEALLTTSNATASPSSKNVLQSSQGKEAEEDVAMVVEDDEKGVVNESCSAVSSQQKVVKKFLLGSVKRGPDSDAIYRENEEIIKSLNGVVLGDVSSNKYVNEATHLVVFDSKSRTEKFLCALAKGTWILDSSYLQASKEAGMFLPEEEYELQGMTKFWRMAEKRPFAGTTFFIYNSFGEATKPPRETLELIIKEGGGVLAEQPEDCQSGSSLCLAEAIDTENSLPRELAVIRKRKISIVKPIYLVDMLTIEGCTEEDYLSVLPAELNSSSSSSTSSTKKRRKKC